MAPSATLPIPNLAYQDYPTSVNISVWPFGDKYRALISRPDTTALPLNIQLGSEDVRALNHDLQQAIGQASITRNKAKALEQLAEIGNAAYKSVFRSKSDQELIQSALQGLPKHGPIQVTSDGFALPWDLFYDHEISSSSLAFEKFWGFRYVIERKRAIHPTEPRFPPPIVSTVRPKVGLVAETQSLRYVASKEVPYFARLDEEHKIELINFPSLDSSKARASEMRRFKRSWRREIDIAHLAAHGYSEEFPLHAYLVIPRRFPLSAQDILTYDFRFRTSPLVILNGCYTASVDPRYVFSLVGAFLEAGARGVIATEHAVPDELAAEFTEQLYTRLLAGYDLGVSFAASREDLLHRYNNPVGLLYALYAPPNIRFIKENNNVQ